MQGSKSALEEFKTESISNILGFLFLAQDKGEPITATARRHRQAPPGAEMWQGDEHRKLSGSLNSRGDKRALFKRALCSLQDFWP